MKIKFIKSFRLYNPIGDDMMMAEGTVENMKKEDYAQWLIDNGFAEKVEEQWPVYGDKYWLVDTDGYVVGVKWADDKHEINLKAIGNTFKTEESATRYVDYLKAVATVRQDEGFMEPTSEIKAAILGYGIFSTSDGAIVTTPLARSVHAGEFYFDTEAHAKASVEAHQPEWRTILDYDWSRE